MRDSVIVNLVFLRTLYSQSAASLTMGSLGAYLRSLDFNVELNFIERENHYVRQSLFTGNSNSQIVIAKPNFKDHADLLPYLKRMKAQGATQRVFLCGPFAQLNAESILARHNWCDGIVLGQPEATFGKLLESMTDNLDEWNTEIAGTILREPESGELRVNRKLIEPIPLNDLPEPARDVESKESGSYINLEASRGCLYNCSFCHIPLVSNSDDERSPLNIRSPSQVVDEIERLHTQMGKTLFIFNDSCFWSNQSDDERILRFCEELNKRDLDIHFYIYLRCKPFISEHVLDALVEAGLVRVFLGVENSVERTQLLYKKPLQEDDFESALEKLEKRGVDVHIGYITIEPHSSPDEVLDNIAYLHRLGRLFRLGVILEPVRVIPGSALHNELIDSGLIDENLPYDEITYGYDFEYTATDQFLDAIHLVFREKIQRESYLFEYFSTVTELLGALLRRNEQSSSIAKEQLSKLANIRKSAEDSLLEYLREMMAECRNAKATDVDSIVTNTGSGFIPYFKKKTRKLEVEYWQLVSDLREQGIDRPLDEIYHGLDRP